MKFLFDLFPLLLFFLAYKAFDIFAATAVAIAASVIQVSAYWLKHRRFEPMHLVTLGVVAVFGGMTLIFHNDTFIKWKPTIVYWLFAAIMIGNHFMSKRTLIARMIGDQIPLPDHVWRILNLSWGLFFIVLGLLNLYVAFFYALDLPEARRQEIWVNFKVFWLFGITFAFMIIQTLFLARFLDDAPPKDSADPGN
jgi:intracellular septation protein